MAQEKTKQKTSIDENFEKICILAHDRLSTGVNIMRLSGSYNGFLNGKQICREALEVLKRIEYDKS